jgi:hypothetical protein
MREGDPLVTGDDAVVNGEDGLCVHPHPCHLQQGKPHTQHGSRWQSAYKSVLHYTRGSPLGVGNDAVVNGEDGLCVHPHPRHLQQGKPHAQHGSIRQSAYKSVLHYTRGSASGCG